MNPILNIKKEKKIYTRLFKTSRLISSKGQTRLFWENYKVSFKVSWHLSPRFIAHVCRQRRRRRREQAVSSLVESFFKENVIKVFRTASTLEKMQQELLLLKIKRKSFNVDYFELSF